MNIQILSAFFMWSTVINTGLLLLSLLIFAAAGNFVYGVHTKWFPMPRETFNAIIYAFLGVYKLLLIFLNLVPWVVLSIMG